MSILPRIFSALTIITFALAGWRAAAILWPMDWWLSFAVALAFVHLVLDHAKVVLSGEVGE